MSAASASGMPSTSRNRMRRTPPCVTQTVGLLQRVEPGLHPVEQHLVALAALAGRRRSPICRSGAAAVEPGWRCFQFGIGEALPVAEMHFHQPGIGAVVRDRQAHRRARMSSIVSRVRRIGLATKSNASGSVDQVAPGAGRCARPGCGRVPSMSVSAWPCSRQLGVPVGLPVADEIDRAAACAGPVRCVGAARLNP